MAEVEKYNVAQRLADLAQRLDALFATRLASADFAQEGDSMRARHDALLAELSRQVTQASLALAAHELPTRCQLEEVRILTDGQ